MAVAIENLIDLSLLTQYDSNIKTWTKEQIEQGWVAEVLNRADLPTEGVTNKIYFVEDAILIYSAEGAYQQIGGSGLPQWKDF